MTKKKILKAKTRAKPKAKAKAKHKPSTKRTLEEVLSSLQDLTKNELSDIDLHSRAGTTPETKQTEEPQEEEGDSIQLDITPDQNELVSGETGDIFDGLELLPDVQIVVENQVDQTDETDQSDQADQTSPELNDIRWEDIPVLEDVAEDLSEDFSGTALPDTGALDTDEFQSPDPQQARNIAIQVAARLNIEMRKQGLEGLDIATINRLRDLLVKELAKAAAKSENDEL